jgi:hypothetical protein
MIRCPNGHYYDPAKHTDCPACGVQSLEVVPTRARPVAPPPVAEVQATRARAPGIAGDIQATVGLLRKKTGLDPVVGWLVCIEGPDRGRDYRIRSEKNFIGRDPRMDICVAGDEGISRDHHAAISFNPRNNRFRLLPGDGRGLVYLNGEEVDAPRELKARDLIELGQSRLMFLPFCGPEFQWDSSNGE